MSGLGYGLVQASYKLPKRTRTWILKKARKSLPSISRTEKEALESGTVGWDGELINGNPDWSNLFALDNPTFTPEEQAFLDGPVQHLCDMLDSWQIAYDQDLPPEAWDFMKKNGFFGLEVSKDHGGLGFSSQLHSAVIMKVSSRNLAAGVTVGVPNSLGPAELIHRYGTQEQKDTYLHRLATGEDIPCFALTEPNAGSDAASIEARGTLFMDGNTLSIRLNFEKRYITLAPIATLAGLAFKLEDPENLLGRGEKNLGITVALLKRGTPGLDMGARHRPVDLPFMNGTLKGSDVVIPADMIIGGVERAGQGWKMLMECLAVGRALSLPAMGVTGSQFSAYVTGAYARVRRQFNSAVSAFEGVEEKLASIAGYTYLTDSARLATLQMVTQRKEAPVIPSSVLKYHGTEKMRGAVNAAMDIHGGKAIINGPHNYFVELYKGIPVAITVEGANIMTRNLLIFGQGIMRAHRYLSKEVEALENPNDDEAYRQLMQQVIPHVGGALRSLYKTVLHGLTGARFAHVPDDVEDSTRRYYQQINRLSAAFNFVSDLTLATVGGGVKSKERLSARLGDVFSNLFMASTALWRFEKQGQHAEDLPLVKWAASQALFEAEQALSDALRNHPSMFVRALRPLIMPLGTRLKKPCDKMDRAVAATLYTPGPARERLTANLYRSTNPEDPIHKLNAAFELSVQVEDLEKRLARAVKKEKRLPEDLTRAQLLEAAVQGENPVLTMDEQAMLKRMDALRRDVVMVDSFNPQPISGTKAPSARPW